MAKAAKKVAPKAKAAKKVAKKAEPIIKEVTMGDEDDFDDGYSTPSDKPDDNINQQDV